MSAKKKKKQKSSPGRPVELTAEERKTKALVRNQNYQTSEEYKEHRKNRYANDPDYRAACLANAKAQAEKRTAEQALAYATLVRSQIKKAKSIGAMRELEDESAVLTFSIPELSDLICRPAAVIRGWVNSGRFPAPTHTVSSVGVYTKDQAIAIAHAVIHHLRIPTAHLTSSRHEAIKALAIAAR